VIAEFILPEDTKWKRHLMSAPHDFYHLPEYVALTAKHEGGEPVAFYAESDEAAFLVPLLIRKLPESLGAPDNWYDATTPYGYPAPIVIPANNTTCSEKFLESFREVGAQSGIITAFFRLHPLLPISLEVFAKYGTLVKHGQTVYIDLSLSLEEIEARFRKDHRKNIRKLISSGFHAKINDWSLYEEFIQIYQTTMRRLSASSYYLFSEKYFADLRSSLGDRLNLCTILSPEGEVASSILFIATNNIVQTYLSGTAEKYLGQGSSKLEIATICRWAKENGKSVLHLGGGLGASSDSLFYFKSGFSDLKADFYTYRMILDREKYAKLLQLSLEKAGDKINNNNSDFFPEYRQLSIR
jgi:Acetyltransferase (GNAT) domain